MMFLKIGRSSRDENSFFLPAVHWVVVYYDEAANKCVRPTLRKVLGCREQVTPSRKAMYREKLVGFLLLGQEQVNILYYT
jgi:hypothetical protein